MTDTAGVRTVIEGFATEPNGGYLPNSGILSPAVQRELIRLYEQYRLPTMLPTFAADGALMSYDSDVSQNGRGAASNVDRILGARRSANCRCIFRPQFGLSAILRRSHIPAFFLVLADEVVE